MSDKTTQELYPLLDVSDQQEDTITFTNSPLDIDKAKRRKRYRGLAERYDDWFAPTDIQESRFKGLEKKVLKDYLENSPAHEELMNLVHADTLNFDRINNLVEKIRTEVAKKHVLDESRYSLSTIIRSKAELSSSVAQANASDRQTYGVSIGSTELVEYPNSPTIHIDNLYRWVPTQYVDALAKDGILPSVCTGVSDIYPYIYAALVRNDFWGEQLSMERSKARRNPLQFTQLEITYSPDMEACLRMPLIHRRDDGSKGVGEPGYFVSSKLISLDRMASALIEAENIRKATEVYSYPYDEWSFSPLVNQKVPPDSLLLPSKRLYNEVIFTGFIPPENITVLR